MDRKKEKNMMRWTLWRTLQKNRKTNRLTKRKKKHGHDGGHFTKIERQTERQTDRQREEFCEIAGENFAKIEQTNKKSLWVFKQPFFSKITLYYFLRQVQIKI